MNYDDLEELLRDYTEDFPQHSLDEQELEMYFQFIRETDSPGPEDLLRDIPASRLNLTDESDS